MNLTKNSILALFSVSNHAVATAALRGEDVNEPLKGLENIAESDVMITVGNESETSTNVFGRPLQPCSEDGMAKTGFTRSGQCIDQENDTGSHHICIDLSSTAPDGSDEDFCEVTGQDDWCAEDMPCHEDLNRDCPVENWCVCQWAFERYLAQAGGCDAVQVIECDAVNSKAIEAYREDPEEHAAVLACLESRCNI
mmetsp:Transcript_5563/g.12136  ORF Transcript_5563/g.12136 Transcript_5563/m.12136 type:complete len:196 (+) Transcript_5563:118-705(+)